MTYILQDGCSGDVRCCWRNLKMTENNLYQSFERTEDLATKLGVNVTKKTNGHLRTAIDSRIAKAFGAKYFGGNDLNHSKENLTYSSEDIEAKLGELGLDTSVENFVRDGLVAGFGFFGVGNTANCYEFKQEQGDNGEPVYRMFLNERSDF